jgi:hypothetical protein
MKKQYPRPHFNSIHNWLHELIPGHPRVRTIDMYREWDETVAKNRKELADATRQQRKVRP